MVVEDQDTDEEFEMHVTPMEKFRVVGRKDITMFKDDISFVVSEITG